MLLDTFTPLYYYGRELHIHLLESGDTWPGSLQRIFTLLMLSNLAITSHSTSSANCRMVGPSNRVRSVSSTPKVSATFISMCVPIRELPPHLIPH